MLSFIIVVPLAFFNNSGSSNNQVNYSVLFFKARLKNPLI